MKGKANLKTVASERYTVCKQYHPVLGNVMRFIQYDEDESICNTIHASDYPPGTIIEVRLPEGESQP